MSPRPYQPALLRLLHGAIVLLVVLALISGFWVYNTYDGRWGSLPLPPLGAIQDIHGTIALTFLLVLPFFALYSFHLGDRRLLKNRSFSQLKQTGKPAGWISLQHFANTLMLLAVTLSAITGRMMKEAWLPAGEIDRPVYLAHLIAWCGVFFSLALHVLMGAKVGGTSLLASMFDRQLRDDDRPRNWLRGIQKIPGDATLKAIEAIVIGGICIAFIVPLFSL